MLGIIAILFWMVNMKFQNFLRVLVLDRLGFAVLFFFSQADGAQSENMDNPGKPFLGRQIVGVVKIRKPLVDFPVIVLPRG